MKIVQFCPYTGPAKGSMGTERVIEALTRALIQLGHEVLMFVNANSTNMPAPIVQHVPKDFDIVNAHGSGPEFLDVYGVPWCSVVHGGGSDPKGSHWHNDPRFVCVSKFICNLSGNPHYVHSCVDPNDFIYKDKKEDYFAWIAGTDWGEGKGLFTAIKLAKKLKFKLKIAGIGKNKEIIDLIKSYCDNKIEYLGSVNGKEKSEFIANARALLFYTRLPDACPLTVAESLISGTPVIGSTNGSMPELIINNKTGILCNREEDLIKAILNVKNIDPKVCRQYALDNFSNIVAAKKYLQIYENIIELYKNGSFKGA